MEKVTMTARHAIVLASIAALSTNCGRVDSGDAVAAPLSLTCGDGVLDLDEVCDDGNSSDGDACSADCSIDTTGVLCSESGVQARIDAVGAANGGTGAVVDLPSNSRIRICATVVIDDRIHLRGNGALFLVPTPQSSGVGIPSSDLTAVRIEGVAGFSRISDLSIDFLVTHAATHDHAGVAIDVRQPGVRLENLILRYPGTGISAHDPAGGVVSGQSWRDILILGCRRYGLYLEGGDDGQAGVFSSVVVQACHHPGYADLDHDGEDDLLAVGIAEHGFLGNTHVGALLELNDVNLSISGAAQRSTFLGTYVEGNNEDTRSSHGLVGPVNRLRVDGASSGVVAVGGQLPVHHEAVSVTRVGGEWSQLWFGAQEPHGHDIHVTIPHQSADAAMAFRRSTTGRTCTANLECYGTETCVSGVCTSPGVNSWRLGFRHSPVHTYLQGDPVLTWEFVHEHAGMPALGFSVNDLDGNGSWVHATTEIGSVGTPVRNLCRYVDDYCGP